MTSVNSPREKEEMMGLKRQFCVEQKKARYLDVKTFEGTLAQAQLTIFKKTKETGNILTKEVNGSFRWQTVSWFIYLYFFIS